MMYGNLSDELLTSNLSRALGEIDKIFDWSNSSSLIQNKKTENSKSRLFFKEIQSVRVKPTDDATVISIDFPGVEREDISIQIEGELLTVSAKRKIDDKEFVFEKCWNVLLTKFNVNAISSEFKNGVLEIYVPKNEKEKPRKIKINDV